MSGFVYFTLGVVLTLAVVWVRVRFAGFTAQTPNDYQCTAPQFDLRHHLNGPMRCDGVIFGPLGRVVSRFTGDFDAEWQGNRGIMRENFQYDGGNQQDREWRLQIGNDGSVRAEADDLLGVGGGRQAGAAMVLKYRIRMPEQAGGHVLSVTDWMYVAPNGVVVNRSQFRKFGIKVAELVATIRRVETA